MKGRDAMKRLGRYFSWVVIWMLTATVISKPTFGDSVDSKPILIFRVLNFAQVPADILLEAKEHVERIYDNAQIQTIWLEGDTAVPLLAGRNILQLTILLIPDSAAFRLGGFNDRVTGFAVGYDGIGAHRAYVFAERAKKQAMDLRGNMPNVSQKTGEGLVLGYAIAHETGHLMLPPGHSNTGVMRERMDGNSFGEAFRGNLYFTSNQGQLMRTNIAESVRTLEREHPREGPERVEVK
jgi:hypothetical protein